MKHKNLTKRIIAGLLAIAIVLVLTGVSFDATTAHAMGITYEQWIGDGNNVADYLDTPFTMEIGDNKYFKLVTVEPEWYVDETKYYDWSSSDESIVSMEIFRWSPTSGAASFCLVAHKAGIVTITGADPDGNSKYDKSMTVVVKEIKTAKQSSCKHKWKTTKKATCLYAGIKTCKKCKAKKTIKKKKAHTWVTGEETVKTYPTYAVYYCMDCDTRFDPYDYGWTGPLDQGGNLEKNKAADKAAYDAYRAHLLKCEDYEAVWKAGGHALDNWYFLEQPDYKHPITKKVTVTRCTTCGETPESVKQYE